MTEELSPEVQKALLVVQKLLNLAAKNSNPEEAAAAAAKAQELLAKHNLDAAMVERAGGVDGKREDMKVEGGFYAHQRELWKAVAELNFCLYWSQPYWIEGIRKRYNAGLPPIKAQIRKYRHRLVGRIVNTRTTIAMAGYLEEAIERTLGEFLPEGERRYSKWAASFRQGATDRIIEKVQDRRRKYIADEEKKERAAKRAASGASTSTAISLASFAKTEKEANDDFIHGEGYSAKKAAEAAKEARQRAASHAHYVQWCKDNPKAAKSEWAYVDEDGDIWRMGRQRSYGRSAKGFDWGKTDRSAYYMGQEKAEAISIDQQVDSSKNRKKLK